MKRTFISALMLLALSGLLACVGEAPFDGLGKPGETPGGGGGGGETPAGPLLPVASSRVPRLTHAQWEATAKDLLGLTALPGLSGAFTPDPLGTSSFNNDEAVLVVTSGLWADYQRAAEQLAAKATATAEDLARFVPSGLPADAAGKAKAFVTQFGRRAFRRPLTSAEVDTYAALFAQGPTLTDATDPFIAGVRITVAAMLQSPHFLYRVETSSGPAGQEFPLSSHEVATRLSYALLGTMPTPELSVLADTGALDTAEGVTGAATALLKDPRAKAVMTDFHRQLFRVRQYENIQKDATLFPEFTAQTPAALQREHELFVQAVVFDQGAGLSELLTAPYAFVNRLTAPLYGLPAQDYTDTFQRVELAGGKRKGLLSQAGFLSYFGTARVQNTILRGAFVNHEVLCASLPPPPAAVPPLPALEPGMTNRERVERHTGKGTCGGGCHGALINPIGYGLEGFDAVGRVQTTDNGKPVDASGTYAFDGTPASYADGAAMIDLIAGSAQAHGCYAQHLLEFALGRSHRLEDEALITAQGGASRGGASVQSLLVRLVASKPFRYRAPEVTP